MVTEMIASLAILAGLAALPATPAVSERVGTTNFTASSGASARAQASIRIVSGARFGPGHRGKSEGAGQRRAQINEQGIAYPAQLLEFQ